MSRTVLIVGLFSAVAVAAYLGFRAQEMALNSDEGAVNTHNTISVSDAPSTSTDSDTGATAETRRPSVVSPVATSSMPVSDTIRVATPDAGERVETPLAITGEARGNWFFEATAPVEVVTADGKVVGEGYIEAQDNWMTEAFVPFAGTIAINGSSTATDTPGTVVLRRDNPSGLPANEATLEIPVILP